MIVGCYTLDLYCENADHGCPWRLDMPQQYTGETFKECIGQAKKRGWKIKADKAICPMCAKLGAK